MIEQKIKPFESFCLRCHHYDESSGACSQIHENLRNYPSRFITKCNGEFFIDDPYKMTEQEILNEYQNKVNEVNEVNEVNKVNKEIKNTYDFKTLLGCGKFISGFGWVIVVLGIVGMFGIFGGVIGAEELGCSIIGAIAAGMLSVIMGIGIVAIGQLITCFVSIERNTRLTYEGIKNKA